MQKTSSKQSNKYKILVYFKGSGNFKIDLKISGQTTTRNCFTHSTERKGLVTTELAYLFPVNKQKKKPTHHYQIITTISSTAVPKQQKFTKITHYNPLLLYK